MKNRNKRIALTAAIVACSFAFVGGGVTTAWNVFTETPVLEVAADTPVFTLGSVFEVNPNNIRISFTENFVQGSASSTDGEIDLTNNGASYIEYKFVADGLTANPSHIRSEVQSQTFKLYFLNNANVVLDTAAKGDTITIKAGFTMTDYNGNTYTIGNQDVVYTSNGDGVWLAPGEAIPEIVASDVTIATEKTNFSASGEALLVDFGLTDVGGEAALVDSATYNGWAAAGWGSKSDELNAEVAAHFTHERDGVAMTCGRYVMGQGKFGWDLGCMSFDNKALVAGDILTLKEGFKLYRIDELNPTTTAYGSPLPQTVTVIAMVTEDMSWYFDGTAWRACVWATSAEFTNSAAEKESLCVGSTLALQYALNTGAVEGLPTYSSSDDDVATVSKNGVVTGVSEGTVTITAQFKNCAATVELTVGPAPTVTAITANATFGATKNGDIYLVGYVGETLTAESLVGKIQAQYTYDNGSQSEVFGVTADMISFDKYSNTVEGVTYITVSKDGVSTDVAVWNYPVTVVDYIAPSRVIGWSYAFNFYFADVVAGTETAEAKSVNIKENPLLGISSDMVTLRYPETWMGETPEFVLHSIGVASEKQALAFISNFDASNPSESLVVGSVLTLSDDYRFYKHIDETWVAAYKFADEISYVWTGSAWANYTADATDFQLEKDTLTLPLNAVYTLNPTLLPAGSYAPVSVLSDNTDIIGVDGNKLVAKALGSATVTVTLGNVTKTISVSVEEVEPIGFKVSNDRIFTISKGEQLDLNKIKLLVDYGDVTGVEFVLADAEDVVYTFDSSVVGSHDVTMTVTYVYNGTQMVKDITVSVQVVDVYDQIPSSLWCADDNSFLGAQIAVFFSETFSNPGNVELDKLTAEQKQDIYNHVKFLRDGKEMSINYITFLTNILLIEVVDDNGAQVAEYQMGDQIVLQQGLKFYRWYGETDGMNVPVGEGDYVLVGKVAYDIVFEYNAQNKFYMEIQYVDAAVKSETVEVGLGGQAAMNVVTVPDYATVGDWSYSVADGSVVSVNARGVISGLKIGSTTVTATLSGGDAGNKVVTFTVNVVDKVKGIQLNVPNNVRVGLNTALDAAKLIDLGVTATIVWESGKIEGDVDLSKARVIGYDSEQEGEQEITIRVTVNGSSVTGKMTITVGSAGGCSGCGSVTGAGVALMVGVTALAAAVVCLKKREN